MIRSVALEQAGGNRLDLTSSALINDGVGCVLRGERDPQRGERMEGFGRPFNEHADSLRRIGEMGRRRDLKSLVNAPVPTAPPDILTYSAGVRGHIVLRSEAAVGEARSLTLGSGNHGTPGTFIQYEQNAVTLGAFPAGGFVASDNFGGCDLTILRDPQHQLFGAHVYFEASHNCRDLIAGHPPGWHIVGTWRSLPYLNRWPGHSIWAFAFIEQNNTVQVVAVGLKGMGEIKKVDLADSFRISGH